MAAKKTVENKSAISEQPVEEKTVEENREEGKDAADVAREGDGVTPDDATGTAKEPEGDPVPSDPPATDDKDTAENAEAAEQPYDDVNREDDAQVLVGNFADVVKGEHKGRYGVVLGIAKRDDDGKVSHLTLRTRDADNVQLTVGVDEVVPAVAGRR